MSIQFTDALNDTKYIMFGDDAQMYQLTEWSDPYTSDKHHFELNRNENRGQRFVRFSLTFDEGTQLKDMFVAALKKAQDEISMVEERYVAKAENADKAREELKHLTEHLSVTASNLEAQEGFEKAKAPVASDIQNLVLVNSEYVEAYEEKIHTFTCEVEGDPDILTYTIQRHDEGEGYTIYTKNDNIWHRMEPSELSKLEGRLENEVTYQTYRNQMLEIENLDDLKNLEYEIMEDESSSFYAVSDRVWKAYGERWQELGGELEDDFTEAVDGISNQGADEQNR